MTSEELVTEASRRVAADAAPPKKPSSSAAIPRITIAVCTRDRLESLADCLEALRTPKAAVRAELLVVDNAPSDMRTRNLVRSLAGVRYVREDLPGLDFARNRALSEATGEVVAFVDDDVVVPSGWLAAVGRVFAEQMESWGRGTVAFLVKHALSNDARRRPALRAIGWLIRFHADRFFASFGRGRRESFPRSLIAAELTGCIRGLLAYPISRLYVRRLAGRGGRGIPPSEGQVERALPP